MYPSNSGVSRDALFFAHFDSTGFYALHPVLLTSFPLTAEFKAAPISKIVLYSNFQIIFKSAATAFPNYLQLYLYKTKS